MPTASRTARTHAPIVGLTGVVLLTAVYLAQLPSPLRLDTDATAYLQIASSIADGNGASPPGVAPYPFGYPLLVAALDVAGLGTAWALVALNLAFLAVGVACLAVVLRRGLGIGETATTLVCGLTLLTSSVAKNTMLPLSEMTFFGLVAASLAALTLAGPGARRWLLALGIALAATSCLVRTAGIGLAPAIVLAFSSRRARAIAAGVGAAGALVVLAAVPRYLDELRGGWSDPAAGLHEGRDLLRMLGAAFGNVPQSRLHEVEPFLYVVGALALPLVVWGVSARRRRLGPVDGWVVGSLVVLYVWPSDASRFMLPIFPFLLGYGALLARRRRWRWPLLAYAAGFATLGLVALALSTRLTYAGDAFPERYAGGALAPTYRVAWGLTRPGDRARVDRPTLEMLRRYCPGL